MTPEDIEALANRIDSEELWRLPLMEQLDLPQEQKDRLDAAVNLRRYAAKRGEVREALKKGAEYIRGFKFQRADGISTDRYGCGTHEWHRALNGLNGRPQADHWMYTAKMISDEVPRMILLFEQERKGLPSTYKMCAHDPRPPTELPDNHLRCSLGKETRKCPYLARIEENENMTTEARDEAKAWTCAAHVLLSSNLNRYLENILTDKSDDAFNERLLSTLS